MNWTNDPPRLRTSSALSSGLIEALDDAHGEIPDARQMQQLADSLKPLIGAAALGAGLTAGASVQAFRAGAGWLTAKSPWLALLGGMGAGVVAWHVGGVAVRMHAPLPSATHPAAALVMAPARVRGPGVAGDEVPAMVAPSVVPAPAVEMRGLPALAARSAGAADPSLSDPVAHPADAIDVGNETESALLSRAQMTLASNPSGSLAMTEQHARRFPGGLLAQERELIAIQALLRLGRQPEAVARAEQFRSQFAGSAHMRRLDLLFGRGPADSDRSGRGAR